MSLDLPHFENTNSLYIEKTYFMLNRYLQDLT